MRDYRCTNCKERCAYCECINSTCPLPLTIMLIEQIDEALVRLNLKPDQSISELIKLLEAE